ncbi:fructokinase [Stackebrandtia albiflava]|uniref:Fructokinase n=1 Tax=Stackebrandtia albiflava TaxID=406432 RepID=A0A562UPL0_9ACTN|nr:PfkB family carbohydrate kinase [Stackebrandtia albiflava]TWJ07549.1 fructokinase [Stackebrandtia albiflava]
MILVIGENVVDVLPGGPVAGGGPANTAVGLARLDCPVEFAARLGGDAHAGLIEARLREAGVGDRHWVHTSEPSPVAEVTLDESGGASYRFRLTGAADFGRLPGELPDGSVLADGGTAVHLGSLAAYLPPGADVLEKWLSDLPSGVLVSFDPNIRPVVTADLAAARRRTDRLAGLSHLVKASGQDLTDLYGEDGHEAAIGRWLAGGTRVVVVTDGPRARAHHSGEVIEVVGPSVPVADTVGAGDSFMAGLLARLRRHDALTPGRLSAVVGDAEALTQCLNYAMAVAAITCTRVGADPPTAAEVARSAADHRIPI